MVVVSSWIHTCCLTVTSFFICIIYYTLCCLICIESNKERLTHEITWFIFIDKRVICMTITCWHLRKLNITARWRYSLLWQFNTASEGCDMELRYWWEKECNIYYFPYLKKYRPRLYYSPITIIFPLSFNLRKCRPIAYSACISN